MVFQDKTVLITGGTGSFGKVCAKYILDNYDVKKVIIFSRDELKQYEMAQEIHDGRIRFFIGDVRDCKRLGMAFSSGVDIVIHAAAMKQIPTCEYNPFEAIKTNVLGAQNIIEASITHHVEKVIALSTDKAANPINLYGATKLCSDKLFTAANAYVGKGNSRFSVVRYGNVIGSRGSVIPLFEKLRDTGIVPVTDPGMTRFWITLDHGVRFVCESFDIMQGGEIFVPKIPSMHIMDLVEAIAPGCEVKITGIRPGEKLHEVLITHEDCHSTFEYEERFVIAPQVHATSYLHLPGGVPVEENYSYRSDNNPHFLSVQDLRDMIYPKHRENVLTDSLKKIHA